MQGNRGKLGQRHWYEHVTKSVGTSRGGKVIILSFRHLMSTIVDVPHS